MKLRRRLLPPLVVAAALLGAGPARAAEPVLVVDGRGWGHGVGMAQDGALWMGRSGASTEAILGHFYPGVALGRGEGVVRVSVLEDADRDVVVTFPGGGEVRSPRSGRQEPGFPMTVPAGGAVRVRHDGRYRVVAGGSVRARSVTGAQLLPVPEQPGSSTTSTSTTSTTSSTLLPGPGAPTPTTAPPDPPPPTTGPDPAVRTSDAPVWALARSGASLGLPDRGARYRGELEVVAGGPVLRVLNQVDVEQYLRGMGEVRDPSWPQASLQAQAVAARTYALRAMAAAGEICDTQRCQVYLGQQAEYPAMDRAVRASAGRVLRYRGGFAAAVYSANGGGVSATPSEGFGTADAAHPYLRAAPYETKTPDRWQVRVGLDDVAARLGYPGSLRDLRVEETGPSGRPLTVAVTGSAGTRTVPALRFQRALGLRSTLWATRIELGEAPAPPPPAPEDEVQAFPDQLARAASGPKMMSLDVPPRAPVTARSSDGGTAPIVPASLVAAAVVVTAAGLGLRRRRRPRAEPRDD